MAIPAEWKILKGECKNEFIYPAFNIAFVLFGEYLYAICFNYWPSWGIKNVDGTTGRPPSIGLVHELLPAEINNDGMDSQTANPFKVDPDTGVKGQLTTEEIKIRPGLEKIRELPNGHSHMLIIHIK